VSDAPFVRRLECVGDLARVIQKLLEPEGGSAAGARPLDPLGQRLALDELEHQSAHAVAFFDPVDGGDVRMVQRGDHTRLALEAGQPARVGGERARQDLDRHIATEFRVVSAVDLAHAAPPDEGAHLEDAQPQSGEVAATVPRRIGRRIADDEVHKPPCGNGLIEQDLHLPTQVVVAAAGVCEKRGTLGSGMATRRVVELLDLLPAVGVHGEGAVF